MSKKIINFSLLLIIGLFSIHPESGFCQQSTETFQILSPTNPAKFNLGRQEKFIDIVFKGDEKSIKKLIVDNLRINRAGLGDKITKLADGTKKLRLECTNLKGDCGIYIFVQDENENKLNKHVRTIKRDHTANVWLFPIGVYGFLASQKALNLKFAEDDAINFGGLHNILKGGDILIPAKDDIPRPAKFNPYLDPSGKFNYVFNPHGSKQIIGTLGDVLRDKKIRDDDWIWIFLSGHGIVADDTQTSRTDYYYLASGLTTGDEPPVATMLSGNELFLSIEQYADKEIKNKKKLNFLVFIDTCFSGAFIEYEKLGRGGKVPENLRLGIFTSSKHDQLSWEYDGLKNGYFTSQLLDFFNTNKEFTLEELRVHLSGKSVEVFDKTRENTLTEEGKGWIVGKGFDLNLQTIQAILPEHFKSIKFSH